MKYFRFTAETHSAHKEAGWRIANLSGYLAAAYKYYFRPTKTDGISAFHILFSDQPTSPDQLLETVTQSVCIDWAKIETLTDDQLIAYLLECAQENMLQYANTTGWNTQPFDQACKQILDNQFLFRKHYKKAVWSPDKTYKAQVYFEFDYKASGTYIDFTDKNGIRKNLVRFTPSGYAIICQSVGSVSWIDETSVKIWRIQSPRNSADAECNKQQYWTVNINGEAELCDMRSNEAQILYQLGLYYYEGKIIFEDKSKALRLITQAADMGYKHAQNWLKRNRRF